MRRYPPVSRFGTLPRFLVAGFFLGSTMIWAQTPSTTPASNKQTKEAKEAKTAEKTVASRIAQVTIYPDTALVTREVTVPEEKGLYELIVSPLPPAVVTNSLYGEGSEGVRVMATRYRSRAVESDTRKEVREIVEQEEKLQLETMRIQSESKTIEANAAFLTKLEGFVAASTTNATEKGKLDSEQVTNLSNYVMELRKTQSKAIHDYAVNTQEIQKKLAFLQRKRAEVAVGSSRTEREAVLVVERTEAGKGSARLSYLVDNASWKPQYRLRSGSDAKGQVVKVEYLAAIAQHTGEDWKGVKLVLSNAQPMLNAAPPSLRALAVGVTSITGVAGAPNMPGGSGQFGGGQIGGGPGMLAPAQSGPGGFGQQGGMQGGVQGGGRNGDFNRDNLKNALEGKTDQLEVANPGGFQSAQELEGAARQLRSKAQNDLNKRNDAASNQIFNYAGALDQAKDLVLATEEKNSGKPVSSSGGDGPSITYRLDGSTTISSRNDEQILEVARLDLPAETFFKAVPVLTRSIYRQANLTNNSNLVLLPGEATMFHQGDFVGRMGIPLVAVGESFTVGFGAEPQLQIQRSLMEKGKTTQGGNQVLKYDYRILVSSYLKEKVKLQVWDRLPWAEGETVNVTLGKTTPELSKDGMYQREERPRNLLRWDLEVEPGQTGEKAQKITYEFKMELDKKLTIGSFMSR